MYNMKIVAIALLIFNTCFLQQVLSASQDPVINDNTTVKIPVTEVNPSGSNSGIAVTSESSVAPTFSTSPFDSNGTLTSVLPDPNNTTTIPSNITTTTQPPPNITTTQPPSTAKPPTTSTIVPSTTSSKPTPNSTTAAPPSSTSKPTGVPTTTPTPANRRFDGPSFIGGIVLALGLVAIGFVAFKFYKARTELNYHTL